MPLTASLVVGGISALGKIGTGFGQIFSGKKKERNNVRPFFDIQDEYFDNRDIAARTAQSGLTASALDFYSDQAEEGLASTTGALLQGGGGINAVQGAYSQYLKGARSIAAEDSQLQQKNILAFLDRNEMLAKQKTQQWVLNKYQPYKDTAAAAAQEKSAGIQNVFGGLNEGSALLAAAGTAQNNADMNEEGGTGNTGRATTNATPVATYYNGNSSSSPYSDFNDPYYVPPVAQRMTDAQTEAKKIADETGMTPEQWDIILRTYKGAA